MNHRLFVCGDTHGMTKDTRKLNSSNFPEQKELTKDDVLIQLGDFGWVWFPIGQNKEQEHWLDWLASRNYTLAVVPGNHENYDIIDTLPTEEKWGNEVKVLSRKDGNIYFLKRGGVYTINGRKILAIGGAESWDKENRIAHVSWWEQEALSFSETENCLDEIDLHDKKVDYILTHTCPSKYIKDLVSSDKRRRCSVSIFLDHVDDVVSFKSWHFGHFHQDKAIKRGKYRCHYEKPPHELE